LQRTLEKLDFPFHEQIVADVEAAGLGLADVPQPGADRAGAVAQFDLQVGVAVAVRPELLVRDQVHFLDRLAVGQLLNETSAHVILRFRVVQSVALRELYAAEPLAA